MTLGNFQWINSLIAAVYIFILGVNRVGLEVNCCCWCINAVEMFFGCYCCYVVWASTGIQAHVAVNVWVSPPALNPPGHKSTPAARQTESDPDCAYHTTPPSHLWVTPSPLWTWHSDNSWLANSWLPSQVTPATCSCLTATCAVLPWLSPGYPSTQKFQAGLVQYNQFAVSAGTFWHHL